MNEHYEVFTIVSVDAYPQASSTEYLLILIQKKDRNLAGKKAFQKKRCIRANIQKIIQFADKMKLRSNINKRST